MKIKVTKIAEFSGHRDSLYALTSNPERTVFYSAGADGWVVAWQKGGEDLGKLIGEVPESIYSACLDAANERIIVGTRLGNIYILPLSGGSPRMVQAHKGGIFCLILLADGSFLSGGEDGMIYRWDSDLRAKTPWMQCHGSVRSIHFPENNDLFAVGSSDHKVRWGWFSDPASVQVLSAHTQSVFAVRWDHEGRFLYSAGRDAMLRRWEPGTGSEPQIEIPAHLYHIHYLDIHPTGDLMLSCSMDKTIKIWQLPDLKLLKVVDLAKFQAHRNSVNKVLWIGENEFISCGDDRTVQHFKFEYLIE